MATLSKTENMRAGIVTKSDVEEFVKLGCAQCIVWKMQRAPVKSLVDATLAPPGKKWSYDTLTLKVKTATGNLYITRFLDNQRDMLYVRVHLVRWVGHEARLFAYLEMQTETRSLLGLLLWHPVDQQRFRCHRPLP